MSDKGRAKMNSVETAFGPPLADRECGACDVCCVETAIDTLELKKAQGVRCEHAQGGGCAIYETRFPVCRGFYCLWRRIDAMPDEARPDKLGVMFGHAGSPASENPFEKFFIHALAFEGQDAIEKPLVQDLLGMFAQGDVPVWISTQESERTLIHPEADVAMAAAGGDANVGAKTRAKALEWESGTRKRRPKGLWAYFLQLISAK